MTEMAEQLQSNEWKVNYPSLGLELNCVLNTDKDKIQSNIESALKRDHERVWPFQQQDTNLIICAGGPSLIDGIEEIKKLQDEGGKVIALANAAHILLKHGIRPNGQVLLDAKPRNAEFIQDSETALFIASQCDPGVFDRAEETGNKIYMYHAVNNDDEFKAIHDVEDKWIPIQGGSTITMRSIRLFNILGYHKFHVFGWDSCYRDDSHHAYEQPDADKHKKFKFEFEDRLFTVSPWMISQALESINFFKSFCMGIDMKVHGDGLIAYIIEKSAKLKVDIKEAN